MSNQVASIYFKLHWMIQQTCVAAANANGLTIPFRSWPSISHQPIPERPEYLCMMRAGDIDTGLANARLTFDQNAYEFQSHESKKVGFLPRAQESYDMSVLLAKISCVDFARAEPIHAVRRIIKVVANFIFLWLNKLHTWIVSAKKIKRNRPTCRIETSNWALELDVYSREITCPSFELNEIPPKKSVNFGTRCNDDLITI